MSLALVGLILLVGGLSWWGTGQFCKGTWVLARLDHPNKRSLHDKPTPRTGGLAILGSLAVGVALALVSGLAGAVLSATEDPARAQLWGWVLGMTLTVAAVSFWDDRVGASFPVRLLVHGLAASGVVWGAGLRVWEIHMPGVGGWPLGVLAGPLTVLGLMWMTNLYNFMDGMDGLAGGMTVVGFGTLGCLAAATALFDLASVSLLVVAAAAGFLRWNWPPAKIFMGDAGSIPLGFLAGTFVVMGIARGAWDLWVGLLVFGPFIADAFVTLIRRALRGVRVWEAHREHYYQRLVLAGWSHRQAVEAEYALMLASAAMAVLYVHSDDMVQAVIVLTGAGAYAALAWMVRAIERQAPRGGSAV
jgi:UDP-N-acetylmuramyl pentapeptide phosphotransferase/UDP-N-acetylglucosamine-1-phosphate transferase